jgi:plasmid stabilization system protein ParE
MAEDLGEGIDDMAVWNAFEEEIADGLDAADEDEFIGRLLGGLGRAAGVVSRGLGGAAGIAGRVGRLAQGAGRVAGGVGRVAGAVSPAAMAASRLAGLLGAPGVAGALGQVGRAAQTVQRGARRAQGLAGSLGQTAGGAQGLFSQLSQLLAQGGNEFDDFDAVIDLYAEDGVDEALPAAVALAARAAARGLGFRNVTQLSQTGRRALVRGVAAAARELVRGRSPQAVRGLPRLAHAAARVAQRRVPTPQAAAQALRRGLPQTARRIAQNPRAAQRVARAAAAAPRPLARPTTIGRGMPGPRPASGPRQYSFSGPVTLTITPR